MCNRRVSYWLLVACSALVSPRYSCVAQPASSLIGDDGDPKSEVALGDSYASGIGTVKDLPAAVTSYRKAADKGFALGQYKLGMMYENGSGLPKDPTEGAKWFRKAADQGYIDAQITLGSLYMSGDGVPSDISEA